MHFPIHEVRAHFPALQRKIDGVPAIYLDNPAGTQVPAMVARAVSDTLLHSNANLGGNFVTSIAAGHITDQAHEKMVQFLGADDPGEIIIGQSMTSLTFHLSRAICRTFKPGDEIIVTRMDHEGNIAPWLVAAEEHSLKVRFAEFSTETWQIERETLADLINSKTRLVALSAASNLTGSINDIAGLVALAREAGALTYVDAVQYAPHVPVDVKALGCDFLACSSYKFFGPHLGIVWADRTVQEMLEAPKARCLENEPGVKFEAGTPQIELLAGLSATIDYYAKIGEACGEKGDARKRILAAYAGARDHEDVLAGTLISGLEAMKGIEIFGITNPNRIAERVPTISFRHDRIAPAMFSRRLAQKGIFVWDGHNYALEVVRQLNIREDEGVVRVGIAHYNTTDEINAALSAIEAVIHQNS